MRGRLRAVLGAVGQRKGAALTGLELGPNPGGVVAGGGGAEDDGKHALMGRRGRGREAVEAEMGRAAWGRSLPSYTRASAVPPPARGPCKSDLPRAAPPAHPQVLGRHGIDGLARLGRRDAGEGAGEERGGVAGRRLKPPREVVLALGLVRALGHRARRVQRCRRRGRPGGGVGGARRARERRAHARAVGLMEITGGEGCWRVQGLQGGPRTPRSVRSQAWGRPCGRPGPLATAAQRGGRTGRRALLALPAPLPACILEPPPGHTAGPWPG